jgi:hypothetical protein
VQFCDLPEDCLASTLGEEWLIQEDPSAGRNDEYDFLAVDVVCGNLIPSMSTVSSLNLSRALNESERLLANELVAPPLLLLVLNILRKLRRWRTLKRTKMNAATARVPPSAPPTMAPVDTDWDGPD